MDTLTDDDLTFTSLAKRRRISSEEHLFLEAEAGDIP
jgi:hypothetical protein